MFDPNDKEDGYLDTLRSNVAQGGHHNRRMSRPDIGQNTEYHHSHGNHL